MIQSQQMEDSSVQIMDVNFILNRPPAKLVGRSVDHAGIDLADSSLAAPSA